MSWFSLTPIGNLPAPVFTDTASAQAWLAQLLQASGPRGRELATSALLDTMSEQLERLQGARLDGSARATLLEALRPEILRTLASHRQRFAYAPRPLTALAFAALNSSERLWTALSTGYLQCCEEFAAPGRDPAWAATASYRAMVILKLALEDYFFAGVEPPPLLWQRALRIVELCAVLRIAGHTIADPAFPELGQSTSLQQYSLLAMTAIVDPYSMTAIEYGALQRLLGRWRDLPEFSAARDEDSKRRWVNLRLLEGTIRDAANNPLWLDVSLVRSKIKKRIESLEAGETPESLGLGRELPAAVCVRLLARARDKLHEAYDPASRAPNQVSGESVFIADNIEAAFSLITGARYNQNAKASATSDKVLHERMALFGRNSIIQNINAEKPAFGEEWALEPQRQASSLGLALGNRADAVQTSMQIGQLIVLRHGEHLALAKVTRAVVRQSGKIEVSALPYPGKPKAVEGHIYDPSGQIHFPFILLAADAAAQTPACIFLPPGIGAKARQPIETNLLTPRKARITGLIDRGSNFDCYRFDAI